MLSLSIPSALELKDLGLFLSTQHASYSCTLFKVPARGAATQQLTSNYISMFFHALYFVRNRMHSTLSLLLLCNKPSESQQHKIWYPFIFWLAKLIIQQPVWMFAVALQYSPNVIDKPWALERKMNISAGLSVGLSKVIHFSISCIFYMWMETMDGHRKIIALCKLQTVMYQAFMYSGKLLYLTVNISLQLSEILQPVFHSHF